MAEGKIVRKGGGGGLEVTGQQIVTGEFQETISKFETVNYFSSSKVGQWETSITLLPAPDIDLPSNSIYANAFSPNEKYVAYGHFGSPYLTVYKFENESLVKLPTLPSPPPERVRDIEFSPNGEYLVTASRGTGSGKLNIWKVDSNTDTFTKIPTTFTFPNDNFNDLSRISWSIDNNFFAVGLYNSPRAYVFKRVGDTFTELPLPSFPNINATHAVFWSKDTKYLYVFSNPSNGDQAFTYERDGDNFTVINTNTIYTGGAILNSDVSPDGNYVVITTEENVRKIRIYRILDNGALYELTTTTLIRYLFTINNVSEILSHVSFGPDSRSIFAATTGSSGNKAYILRINETEDILDFGSNLLSLGSVDSNGKGNVDVSSSGQYVSIGTNSDPNARVYKTTVAPDTTKIFAANNKTKLNAKHIGYALEDGVQGETKSIMSLFRSST